MTNVDSYADWDAAYVLGALTVQQRHEYEDHLAGCEACRRAVGELAGMSGLLAQVPAAEAIALNDQSTSPGVEPVPDSIRSLKPPRRLSTWSKLAIVAAVVLALIVGGVGGFLLRGAATPPAPTGHSPVLVTFASDHPASMIAKVRLTSSQARTKIDVDCAYAMSSAGSEPVNYALETIDDHGTRKREWMWDAQPGEDHKWQGWSSVSLADISTLQIVNVDSGDVLMSAPVR